MGPLSHGALLQVVRLQLTDVLRRLEEIEVSMQITDAAIDQILKESFDPQMGARPLKRFIEKYLVSRLSALVLSEQLVAGSIVTIDWRSNQGSTGEWDFHIVLGTQDKQEDDLERTSSAIFGRT